MTTDLVLEAFGQLDTRHPVIVTAAEDLYSAFRDHAELMGWSAPETQNAHHPLLWHMHEAEMTAAPGQERIGWAQVGLAFTSQRTRTRHHGRKFGWAPFDILREFGRHQSTRHHRRKFGWAPFPMDQRPVVASVQIVPALCQCLHDTLQRFGTVTLTGLQLTVYPHGDRPLAYLPGDNWFHLTPRTQISAVLSLDHNWLGEAHAPYAQLQRAYGACMFKDVMPVPEHYRIARPTEMRSQRELVPAHYGLEVALPEWTVKALGWVMARVMRKAPARRPYALRITRLP